MRRAIDDVNWADLAGVHRSCGEILRQLADRNRLRAWLSSLPDTEAFAFCEHKAFQDKIVLHRDRVRDTSVRLHVFLPGHQERAQYIHDHRWTFAALILHGGYAHRMYERRVSSDGTESFHVAMAREESRGAFYALGETAYHAVSASPYTTTLLIRGPAVKRAARFVREDGGRGAFERFGAAEESRAAVEARRMTPGDYERAIQRLSVQGVA